MRSLFSRPRGDNSVPVPVTRFLTHPFEIAFGVLFWVIGTSLLLSRGHEMTTVQKLPLVLVQEWTVALFVGGPAMLLGLFWPGSPHVGRAVERAGLYLGASAWATYALTVLFLSPGRSIVPILYGVSITTACIGRARALSKVDKVVQQIADVSRREPRSDDT